MVHEVLWRSRCPKSSFKFPINHALYLIRFDCVVDSTVGEILLSRVLNNSAGKGHFILQFMPLPATFNRVRSIFILTSVHSPETCIFGY